MHPRNFIVCDKFYQSNLNELSEIIHLLDIKKGVKLKERVIDLLITYMIKR